MDNVKYIKRFLEENDEVNRYFFHEHPDETVKVPPPHLMFRVHEEFNTTFVGLSLKYFKSFIINLTHIDVSGEAGGWYLYIRPEHLNPYLSRTKITDDENVLEIDKTIFCPGSADKEKEMCKDILAYIKAGVKQYYHRKEEENNGNG